MVMTADITKVEFERRRETYLAGGRGHPFVDFLLDEYLEDVPTEKALQEQYDSGYETAQNDNRPCVDECRELHSALEKIEEQAPVVTKTLQEFIASERKFPSGDPVNYHLRDLKAADAMASIPWRAFDAWIQDYI